jgi:putative transposase
LTEEQKRIRKLEKELRETQMERDITYLKIDRSCYYLAFFIDLFSRSLVGWDLSNSLERYSLIKALNKAVMRRRPGKGLMTHSEQAYYNLKK